MAVFRDIDNNTRINGSLTVSLASTFLNNLDIDGILTLGGISNVETAINSKVNNTGGTINGNVTINGTLSATSISGVDLSNFYTKTQLNTSGGGGAVHWSNVSNKASASTSAAGIVQLSDATNSTSIALAATANAVKKAYDLADTKWIFDETAIKAVKVNSAVDADKVNGLTVETAVPANAIFTDTIYKPPATWPATMIEQTEYYRFVSDVQINAWNAKPSTDTTYTAGNGLRLLSGAFSVRLSSDSGLRIDGDGALYNSDKASTLAFYESIASQEGSITPADHKSILTVSGSGKISTSAANNTLTIKHTDGDHTVFARTDNANTLAGINTFSSELIIQPATAPAAVNLAAKTWASGKIILGSVDALTEEIYNNISKGIKYIRDTDYSIDYKTGTITRINGSMPATVYVSYIPTKFVFKVKGSAADATDYFQIDNKGNIYGKSMTVTLSSSQESQDSNALGNFSIQGNLDVKGQTTLGDANTDLTKVNGVFSVYNGVNPTFTVSNDGILTAGSVPWLRITNIPEAAADVYGVVKLSDSVSIISSSMAASSTAVKAAYDLANTKWTYNASTIQNVKVNNAVNADKVNNLTVETAVPANAKFTDTIYKHPAHTGDVTSTPESGDGALTIGTNKVTNEKIRQSAGLSVIGNATSTLANVTDITASANYQVLKRNGIALEFGLIASANISDKAITLAKIQDVSTAILLGRTTENAGVVEQLTAAQVRTLLNVENGANNYLHPSQTAIVTTNTAPTVIKDITVDGLGHVTKVDSHTLTLFDLSYTGDTNANYYEHPTKHPASIITQDASNRFVTDTQITTWNAKSTLALGNTSTTAYRGDYGEAAYNHSKTTHAPSNAQKNSDITQAEIEAKLIGTITSHNHDKINSIDSSGIDLLPNTFNSGLYADLKTNAISGLSDGGTHTGVLTYRSYGTGNDLAKGPVFQLGFTTNGNVYKRRSLTETTWNTWHKIWDEGSFKPSDYLPLAAEKTLTGNLIIGTAVANKNLTVNGTVAVKNLSITSATTITNLNADTVDGFHGREFFDSIFNIGGSGVITGCRVEGLGTEFGCKLSSGRVFIKEYGIKDIAAVESFTGFTANNYHLVFISGETTSDNSYVIGNIGVILNSTGWPSESLMPKNSILLAKIYPTNASAIGNANIYSCRKFISIQSDTLAGTIKMFESDKENSTASSSGFLTTSRLQFSKVGDRTTIQLSDIPTADNIVKTLLLETDRITFTDNSVSKVITASKIIDWDDSTTKRHKHVYDATLQAGSTNGGRTFILANYAILTNAVTRVYKNGLRQKFGLDYDLSANTITFTVAPLSDDIIIIDYDVE